MGVITCKVCGSKLNDEALRCPDCGTDPRMTTEEARDLFREQEAARRARQDQLAESRPGVERMAALKDDPVAVARWASRAGLRWLRLQVSVAAADESLARAIGTVAGDAAGISGQPYFLDEIEAEGWSLHSMDHVFRPTGVSAAGAAVAGVGLGVNRIEGELYAVCLFRRAEQSA